MYAIITWKFWKTVTESACVLWLFFALENYTAEDGLDPMVKAINVMLCKLEGQTIMRHPEYGMNDRLIFKDFDFDGGKVTLPSGTYELTTTDFPTVDRKDPYRLSEGEERLLKKLSEEFLNSERLQRHMRFFLQPRVCLPYI